MILSRNALAVMLGGGAGAVCRVMMEKLPSVFPLGVLCANVLGGFLMGLLQGWMRRMGNTFATGYCLLGTGFLGGFTTFSTFSLDTFLLYRSGDASLAALNIALNMVLCRVPASWRRLSRPRLPLPAAASARRQPDGLEDVPLRHGSLSPVRGGVSRHCPARCGAYPQTDGKSRARVQ